MSSGSRVADARRGLTMYFVVLVFLTAAVEGVMIARGLPIERQGGLVVALMWSPTLAMIVARVVRREGIRDISLWPGLRRVRGAWREYLIAWLYPLGVGAVAYGAAWGLGLAEFGVPPAFESLGPAVGFLASAGLSLTLLTLFAAITALGEELGWRGYMLTRLVDAGVPRPALASGLIWAAWHAPLILAGLYAAGPSPLLSTALFFLILAGQGFLYARLRLTTGSVWPAVLLHSAWNATIQGTFDAFVPGHTASQAGGIWLGEAGVLVVLAATVGVGFLCRRGAFVRRFPADEDGPQLALREL